MSLEHPIASAQGLIRVYISALRVRQNTNRLCTLNLRRDGEGPRKAKPACTFLGVGLPVLRGLGRQGQRAILFGQFSDEDQVESLSSLKLTRKPKVNNSNVHAPLCLPLLQAVLHPLLAWPRDTEHGKEVESAFSFAFALAWAHTTQEKDRNMLKPCLFFRRWLLLATGYGERC